MTATVLEAGSQLMELIRRAQAGEEVLLTAGAQNQPVARLEPVKEVAPTRLGALEKLNWELGTRSGTPFR